MKDQKRNKMLIQDKPLGSCKVNDIGRACVIQEVYNEKDYCKSIIYSNMAHRNGIWLFLQRFFL